MLRTLKPCCFEQPHGVVRSLADDAVDPDFAVAGQLAEPCAKFAEGDADRAGNRLRRNGRGGANVERQRAVAGGLPPLPFGPMADRERRRGKCSPPRSRPYSPGPSRCRIAGHSIARPLPDRRRWPSSESPSRARRSASRRPPGPPPAHQHAARLGRERAASS